MADWRMHTPDGVNDILPEECAKKREIENTIWTVFASMGYKEVETPTFEYYDVFASGGGQISQESMFKFFDEHGRILTLRPDITTSIARMAATKELGEELPLRYCYTGSVFRAEKTQGVRQREITQEGIELIGANSPKADAEVIAAMIEAVLAVGIEEFQVEIGQVAFFNGLMEQAGLDSESIEKLRARIDCKDRVGIRDIADTLDIDDGIKSLIEELPYLFGGVEIVDKAMVDGLNETSKAALENIKTIYNLLAKYGFERYISLDLGMLQSIDYYTGSIFKCYTHGIGFPICAGGRYDKLTQQFGADMGAVGAAFGINRIMSVLQRTGIDIGTHTAAPMLVFAENGGEEAAYDISFALRSSGYIVEMYLDEGNINTAEDYAVKITASCLIRTMADGKIMLKDFATGEISEMTADEFIGYCTGEFDEDDDCDCGHEHHHDHDCGCGHCH